MPTIDQPWKQPEIARLQMDPLPCRLLVTGATGFLGSEIVLQAVQRGILVRGTGRQQPSWSIGENAQFLQIDLGTSDISPDNLRGFDCVLHVAGLAHQFGKAGEDQAKFQLVNVTAAARVAQAAADAGVKQFVLVSSVGVYGPGDGVRDEQSTCNPSGFYAESKLDGEKAVQQICDLHQLPLAILRMATLYGEGDRGNVQRLISGVHRGSIPFFGAGKNRKSLLHVADAATACLQAAESDLGSDPGKCGVFNVAGQPALMLDVFRNIRVALGKRMRFLRIPMWMIMFPARIASTLPGLSRIGRRVIDILHKWSRDDAYDGTKFQNAFQWRPKISLTNGLRRQAFQFRLTNPSSHWGAIAKRIFDVVLGSILLLLFGIPMLIIALLVKFTSPGPMVYYSNRVGKDNQIFPMPKFRSMRTDTPQVATHLLQDASKYITPIGKFLRKTSLDELPQLLSVLRGHMSFVGPRPALFNQEDLIALRDDAHVSQLKPGITGWAQINGRDELAIPEKVVFDQQYLFRLGIINDIRIIIQTGLQAFVGTGVRSADEADGIAPWQQIVSSPDRSWVIITEPEATYLVDQSLQTAGKKVSLVSLRKPELMSRLLAEFVADKSTQILVAATTSFCSSVSLPMDDQRAQNVTCIELDELSGDSGQLAGIESTRSALLQALSS